MNKSQSVITEIDIVYKKKVKSSDLPVIINSARASEILRSIWSDKIELCEEFILLLLNNSNKCLGWVKISQGGMSGTVVDYKIILACAIKSAATGIMISHNHPSGNINPSQADIHCTKRLNECCKMFDIKLIDHVILSGDTDSYYSFADNGDL